MRFVRRSLQRCRVDASTDVRQTVAVRKRATTAPRREKRSGRNGVPASLIYFTVLLTGCSGDKDPSATASKPQREAATADLGPLPSDRAGARAWLQANSKRIDRFRAVAQELAAPTLPSDCASLAERFNAELGPISDHLKQVAASPDVVLGELLTSAAISARTMVAACTASDTSVADDERSGLANALVLIERRQAELKGRR